MNILTIFNEVVLGLKAIAIGIIYNPTFLTTITSTLNASSNKLKAISRPVAIISFVIAGLIFIGGTQQMKEQTKQNLYYIGGGLLIVGSAASIVNLFIVSSS